ncbi:hypothetical protein [Dactylosporangium sp. CA-233914]|uniref:hypothetical protein n=1 Tax=Dactylosporangium sp. CA-233914 TaxID=3239934 RepID=UPI003D90B7FA
MTARPTPSGADDASQPTHELAAHTRTQATDHAPAPAASPPAVRRTFRVTATVTVDAAFDLRDPFARYGVFQALVDQLAATPMHIDTPKGHATAQVRLVTAES